MFLFSEYNECISLIPYTLCTIIYIIILHLLSILSGRDTLRLTYLQQNITITSPHIAICGTLGKYNGKL